MKVKLKLTIIGVVLLVCCMRLNAQINVDVNLNIKHSVDGVSDFGRERHIISHTGPTDPDWSGHEDMMDYFFNDLDVYFGRDNGSAGWKNKMITEDPEKPHWPDQNSLESVGTGLKNWYESEDHIDRHQYETRLKSQIMGMNPYPIYPSLDWGSDGKMNSGWQTYDVDAAAHFTAQYLNTNYSKTPDDIGEPLPQYWECMNEPDMAVLKPFVMFLSSFEKLYEFHNLSAIEIRNTLGEYAPKIGGFTWGQHDFFASDWINRVDAEASYYNYSDPAIYPVYDNMWLGTDGNGTRSGGSTLYQARGETWWQWDALFQGFIDACGANMDFYSVHIYDWPDADNEGTIRTGGHTEAMLDMLEWYDLHKFGTRKDIIISEYGSVHGGYITGLGYKRRDWENLRPFNQMFMQFLERPSHLTLTMPFAPIKATWGDYWNYSTDPPTLTQRYEVTMMDPVGEYTYPGNEHPDWEWSDIILWYELWSDVKGTRIDTKASDRDIQVDAYVDGNHIYLILNNLEVEAADININLFDDFDNDVVKVKMKHQYLNTSINRPVNQIETMASAPGQVTLAPSATMILDYEFANPVTINQESREYKYMSEPLTNVTNRFGSQLCYVTANAGTEYVVNVNSVDVPSVGEATLRIGMRVWNGIRANIVLNNQTVLVGEHQGPELDVRGRERSRGGHGFWGMIEVDVPVEDLQANNEIKIMCPHSNMEISSVQIQTWDFTKAPGRSSDGTGYVAVSSIALAGNNTVMHGEELPLKVEFTPLRATKKGITWSSSNPAVATINEFGVVTGVATSGTTTITATSVDNGAAIATTILTAIPFQPTSVAGIEIQEGNSISTEYYVNTPLTALISPIDATVQTIEWTSSNPDLVYVNPTTGKITGKAINQSATITATVIDTYSGNAVYSDAIDVFVTIAGEESVFNRRLPDTIRPYPQSELSVDVRSMGSRRVEIELSKNGTLIGEGALDFEYYGDTTLSVPYSLLVSSPQIETDYDVTFRLFNGSAQLDVSSAIAYMADHYRAESVEIAQGIRQVQIGASIQLESIVLPENTYNQAVAWSSSNPGIASVNTTTGVVTGNSVGDALITVTTDDGGFTDQVSVHSQVEPVLINITSIELPDTIYIFPGTTKGIDYSYAPEWATLTEINWISDNPGIVAIDADGNITAGNTLSDVTITASAVDTNGVSTNTTVIVTQTVFVEAEDFAGTGGAYDGFIVSDVGINNNQAGDWGDYEVDFPVGGEYSVCYYIGAPDDNTDIAVNLYIDGALKQTTTLSSTGGWDNYQPFDALNNISVSAGVHTVRIESTGSSDWQWNMDRFEFTLTSTLPCDALVSISTPATLPVGINGQSTVEYTTDPVCQKDYSTFTWSSLNTNIATVDQNGVVTGIAVGQVEITVQSGTISSTTFVTVDAVDPTSITVEPGNVNLVSGGSTQLNAVVLPDYASDKSVTWSSDNSNISVDQNGIVTGTVIGEVATITATSVADNSVTGSAIVTIVDAPQSITIEAEDFVETGGTLDDSQWGGPGIGVKDAGTYIEWVNAGDWVEYGLEVPVAGDYSIAYQISTPSDNAQIQFVLDGTVTSTDNVVNNGDWLSFINLDATSTVTLSAGSHTLRIIASGSNTWQWNLDKIVLTKTDVCDPITSVDIQAPNTSLTEGSCMNITTTILPSTACQQAIVYNSSDAGIATVDANGVVCGISSGLVTITATVAGLSDQVSVTVEAEPCEVLSISIDQNNLDLEVNEGVSLNATVNSTGACSNNVTWSSSDETVATVSSSGLVTAVSEGTAEIVVSSDDNSQVTASCSVSVNAGTPDGDFALGNEDVNRAQTDGWSSNMLVNESDTYTNTSGAVQQIQIPAFNFYAWREADPVTPFVVKVNGDNSFTVLAVGTTRNSSEYNIGSNSFAFNEGTVKVISVANGETIATGFLDANADGTGGGSGSVIPFDQNAPTDQLWYSGGGAGDNSGSVTEGVAPIEGAQTLSLARNYSYNIEFTTGDIPVEGVSLSSTTLSLDIGETSNLIATVIPDNATNKNVNWSSDNPGVATVSDNGLVSAISGGTAEVSVTTADGGFTAICTVSVSSNDDQTPYPDGTPHSLPGSIAATNFDIGGEGISYHDATAGNSGNGPRQDTDVDTEYRITEGNIGWIAQDEWLEYTVDVTVAGNYTIEVLVASIYDVGAFHIEFNEVDVTGIQSVPNTGSWGSFSTVSIIGVALSAGQQVMRVYADGYSFNLGTITFAEESIEPVLLTIEAEDFSETGGTLDDSQWGGPGVGVNRTSANINWVNSEDWVDYNVTIPQDGAYEVVYYISSPNDGSTISMSVDGDLRNTTTVPNNGAWDDYQPLIVGETENFSSGDHIVRLTAGAQTWTWNLDKFTLEWIGQMKSVGPEEPLAHVSDKLSIYPNPASGLINVYIEMNNSEIAKVELFNLQGLKVRHEIVPVGVEYSFDISGLSPGIYYVRVNGLYNKLIVE